MQPVSVIKCFQDSWGILICSLTQKDAQLLGHLFRRRKHSFAPGSLLSSVWSCYKWLIKSKDFVWAGSSFLRRVSPHCLTQCMPLVKYRLLLLHIIYTVAGPELINSCSALAHTIRACSSNRNVQPLYYLSKERLLLHIYRALALLWLIITEVFTSTTRKWTHIHF